MLLMCQIGLTLAFFDGNHAYQSTKYLLNKQLTLYRSLDGQLQQARGQIRQNETEMNRFQEIRYKFETYRRQYPQFSRIVDTVIAKCNRYGFHPDLILSIIQIESSFNPFAISTMGAYGLMQIRYEVWKEELNIDKAKIFDIDYNIDLGLRILQSYFQKCGGNLKNALFMYNNGYKYMNTGYSDKVANATFCQERNLEEMITGAN